MKECNYIKEVGILEFRFYLRDLLLSNSICSNALLNFMQGFLRGILRLDISGRIENSKLHVSYRYSAALTDQVAAPCALFEFSLNIFSLNSANSVNHDKIQKWYGYQRYYPFGNKYITSASNTMCIFITAYG